MLAEQQRDLSEYGAEFSRWFRESSLHGAGDVGRALSELEARGMTYRAVRPEIDRSAGTAPGEPAEAEAQPTEPATFVRTGRFGDDKDRVIVKSNGAPTYLLPDIAYHRDKHARGFERSIDLWGPDHHGHIVPLRASLVALGLEPEFLEVLIVQQVNLMSGGQAVKMGKRAGTVHLAARPDGGRGRRLREVLLPDALDQRAPRFRPRSRAPAERREPGVLRAVRARAHRLGAALRGGAATAAARERGRGPSGSRRPRSR